MRNTILGGGLLAAVLADARPAEPEAANMPVWAMKNIEITATLPPASIAETMRLATADYGDARITVDAAAGYERTPGTILLIAGRWMATNGLVLPRGSELRLMDTAARNS